MLTVFCIEEVLCKIAKYVLDSSFLQFFSHLLSAVARDMQWSLSVTYSSTWQFVFIIFIHPAQKWELNPIPKRDNSK